jgi:FMN-dependent oxidoreductase (nitrilotriacetate monooxygenase family)
MARQIRFNAFDMNCVAHQSSGMWRHPDDQSWRYKDLHYWTDLAKLLERGTFDGIFIADVLGTYDVYGGSNEAAIRHGAQVPVNDPVLLVSAMALVTDNLGFGITAGTAYEHPYPFARRMSTLDHLTNGRVGWNVVTGYLPSAARNMGHDDQLEHDDRYDVADEYLEVLYKLWEGSWEDDAVQRNRETGVFTDPSKVHEIGHSGKNFTVPGIHLSEPSTQRTPVIYQAGASPRGIAFAAGNAEAIFVASSTKAGLKATVGRIRDALEAAGRDRYSAKIYTLLTIITDATPELARAKYEDYLQYASEEGALVFMSGWMGIDLSQYDLDEQRHPVDGRELPGRQRGRQRMEGARYRPSRCHRRPRTVHDRFGRRDRRPAAGVGHRDRRRRLQSRLRDHAGYLRGCRRTCDSGAARPWRLSRGIRGWNASPQAAWTR